MGDWSGAFRPGPGRASFQLQMRIYVMSQRHRLRAQHERLEPYQISDISVATTSTSRRNPRTAPKPRVGVPPLAKGVSAPSNDELRAIVELEERPRLISNIVEVPQTPESLVLDMPLAGTGRLTSRFPCAPSLAELAIPLGQSSSER